MRQEVIQQVVAAESEAESILRSARAEAERMVSEAEETARALTSGGREECRRARGQLIEAAVAEACGEKDRRLAKAAWSIEHGMTLDDLRRDKIVAAVVRCACGVQDGGSREGEGSHA